MKNVDKFIFILKKDTEFNGLIPIYTKKGNEQNRFTYSATPPSYLSLISLINPEINLKFGSLESLARSNNRVSVSVLTAPISLKVFKASSF